MKVGSFEIPDLRLIPNSLEVLDEIYSVKKLQRMQSKELAIHLGYKYGTETHFYRKLKSLMGYGLVSGSGNYQVSELGEQLLHPKTDDEKNYAKTKAVMSVLLWKEIFNKSGKNPRADNFWAVLVDITKTDPDTAKKEQSKILKWYLDDIAHVTDKYIEIEKFEQNEKDLRSSTSQNKSLSQQMESPKLNNSSDVEVLSFDKYQVALPKGDLSKEWEILKSYMDIKLKNYKYEESKKNEPKTNVESN